MAPPFTTLCTLETRARSWSSIPYFGCCKPCPKVTYARNITDIDDKIIVAARERDTDIMTLTEEFTDKFRQDMAALNNLDPSIEPQATAHVEAMLDLAARLIERGHAYVSEGHVLFDVTSMEDYGALSGRNLEDMLAGARVEVASINGIPVTLCYGNRPLMLIQAGTAITVAGGRDGTSSARP